MDGSRLISFPTIRRELMKQGLQRLLDAGALQGLSGVAGGESSGIAFAAWLAEKMDLPLQYVRKRAVGVRQIEGVVEQGGKVLLVDDMVSAGQYKLSFIDALRAEGARVEDLFVVFDYGCLGPPRCCSSTACACTPCATGAMCWNRPARAASSATRPCRPGKSFCRRRPNGRSPMAAWGSKRHLPRPGPPAPAAHGLG
jgi:adenine/guanine phosphoribosyltransferase-like PRPP-binding protein